MAENTGKVMIKRQRYIVSKKLQLKYAGVILALMFLTASFCSYAIYYTTMMLFGEKLANVYPQGQLVSIVNTVNLWITISIFLMAPFIVFLGIYLSHKIAGPIYRIERFLAGMSAGDLTTRITLRKGDEMVSLADSINKLTDSLALSVTTEKSRMNNVLSELKALRDLIPAKSKEHERINGVLDKLSGEIKSVSNELDRYKV